MKQKREKDGERERGRERERMIELKIISINQAIHLPLVLLFNEAMNPDRLLLRASSIPARSIKLTS
jgi:hypothetical protein